MLLNLEQVSDKYYICQTDVAVGKPQEWTEVVGIRLECPEIPGFEIFICHLDRGKWHIVDAITGTILVSGTTRWKAIDSFWDGRYKKMTRALLLKAYGRWLEDYALSPRYRWANETR